MADLPVSPELFSGLKGAGKTYTTISVEVCEMFIVPALETGINRYEHCFSVSVLCSDCAVILARMIAHRTIVKHIAPYALWTNLPIVRTCCGYGATIRWLPGAHHFSRQVKLNRSLLPTSKACLRFCAVRQMNLRSKGRRLLA